MTTASTPPIRAWGVQSSRASSRHGHLGTKRIGRAKDAAATRTCQCAARCAVLVDCGGVQAEPAGVQGRASWRPRSRQAAAGRAVAAGSAVFIVPLALTGGAAGADRCCRACATTRRWPGRSGSRPRSCSLAGGALPSRRSRGVERLGLGPAHPARRSTTSRACASLASTSTGAGSGRRSTPSRRSCSDSCCSPTPSTCCSPGRGASPTRSASDRFRSSSAPTCSCGSRTTGSPSSSCSSRSASSARRSCAGTRDGKRGAHLQPVGVHAGAVLAGAAGDRHHQPHLGAGDQHHLQPRAAHLHGALPDRAGGHVLLRDHAGDGSGGGDALRGERAVSWR